jgi:hypothetical protein
LTDAMLRDDLPQRRHARTHGKLPLRISAAMVLASVA